MRIPGKRVKRTRLVHATNFIVAIDVEMVIPDDEPSEPCYEAETVQLLREVKERAEKGDVEWLSKVGRVFAAIGTA